MIIHHTVLKSLKKTIKKSFLYIVIHREKLFLIFLFKTSYILWEKVIFFLQGGVYLTTFSLSRLHSIGTFHIAYEIPTMHVIKCTTYTNFTMISTMSVIFKSLMLCFIFYPSKTVRFQHGTINFLLIMVDIFFFI